ncbi:MAG TPA: MBL fold metallo-hydrolase [Thermoanaerobaculia bacterium]|jgi:beta-lactamase superfamily II metal-dependent hydrolase|nr:MBL fold metallo-hydrolase [Thermoanaerobaculia bacterium]
MAKTTGAEEPLRVRMYRVGFGDFFLLTVPSPTGPQHLLIDCGVTKGTTGRGDIGTLKAAVADMAQETDHKLALIIVTHRHMDHIIGFSRCKDEFEQFEVGAIWMPVWETQYDSKIEDLQAQLTALALDIGTHLALAAGNTPDRAELLAMLENATGHDFLAGGALGVAGTGGGTNAESLRLLKEGLKVKPTYYHKGQIAQLPKALVDAGLAAEILGPPPVDELAFMKLKDLRKGVGQYLEMSERRQEQDGGAFRPFAERFTATPDDYPASAFREWLPRNADSVQPALKDLKNAVAALRKAVDDAQPEVLLTAVKALDGFLNNQSLVVLFTFRGKKLLFAGDAQAGNWEYWLYDSDTPVKAPSGVLGAHGAQVLGHLDFYKVGHHGSTNATPIAALDAMNQGFVALCSTQADTFGSVNNDSEVPRIPLLAAMSDKATAVVRADQIPVTLSGALGNAVANLPAVPKNLPPGRGKLVVGTCCVDYLL